jgi:hypothetical protein
MQSRRTKVAVAQVGAFLFDTARTLEQVEQYCRHARAAGVKVDTSPRAVVSETE